LVTGDSLGIDGDHYCDCLGCVAKIEEAIPAQGKPLGAVKDVQAPVGWCIYVDDGQRVEQAEADQLGASSRSSSSLPQEFALP